MTRPLLLIDGHSLAYRAYFAFPPTLTLDNGQPINAVYGFVTLLFKEIDQFNPAYLAVCFDRKEPTFRHTKFDQYKAHRPPAPPEFISQVELLKTFLQDLKICILEKAGYEADDLIGTLCKRSEAESVPCLILSGDMDNLQLVSEWIKVAVPTKGTSNLEIYGPKEVEAKYQLKIHQLIDMKALKGDASDNIPGVPGIGEKTAVKLISEYDTLENLYAHIDKLDSKTLKQKLTEHKDLAFISKELSAIHCHVPMDIQFSEMAFAPNWPQILEEFKKFKFKSLIQRYSSHIGKTPEAPPSFKPSDGQYRAVQTVKELKRLEPELKKGFAIDLETTGLDAAQAEIVGVSISTAPGHAIYIPCNPFLTLDRTQPLFEDAISPPPKNPFLDYLKPFLEDPKLPKYTHNGKYEYVVFQNYGITLQHIAFDTMLAAFLVFPGDEVGLKALALRHLGIKMTGYEELTVSGRHKLPFHEVPIEAAAAYACADADMTYRLVEFFKPLIKEKELDSLYYDIELPVQTVLAKMETEGVAIDVPYLQTLETDFEKRLEILSKDIYGCCGSTFNISSTKQLAQVLFEQLQLPTIKKTKTGYSTDSSVLEKLKDKHPVIKKLLAYRELEKLLSTYVKSLPALINPRTHRIHTSFNQTVAITGRLSSTRPNLQNIPTRTEEGRKIRRAFIATGPDRTLLFADYSQIELRLMAHFSGDSTMMQAFEQGQDIHRSTAALIFQTPYEDVTKDMRYRAKAVNFGIIYGMSAYGLSENLGISTQEAKAIIDHYFATFPNIRRYMDDTIQSAKSQGYVRTAFGRYRYIPDIRTSDHNRRQFAERIAINTPLQGTAADLIKKAMIAIQNQIETHHLKSKMIIQVHDELIFDIPLSETEKITRIITQCMTEAAIFKVPLVVNIATSTHWSSES